MLRRVLLASVGAIALAGTALAADLPSRAPPPVYVPPAPIFTWTGVYIGGQIGYAWGQGSANFGDANGNFIGFSGNGNGVIGGAHVGYNLQLNQFVVGLEGSVDGSSIGKSSSGTVFLNDGSAAGVNFHSNANVQGSIRGRVGYAWDRVLVYATGGVAFAGVNASLSTPVSYDSASTTKVGWTVGGGVEYAVTNNWSIRAEYRYSNFGNATLYPASLAGFDNGPYVNRKFNVNQVQVGFSYKFDTFAPPAPVVAKY
ncbi:outer membrane protein [Methylocella silvestris]|uniref:Autotransporter outer membrane beta-barrel domain-containing protein n=1 Tax=Methylocella silvestris TaxID=199596 RepID=A0A2J7TCM5_METSI|nr:outer membrane protein [Methylocella silvestris]PNG24521.1 autotransporter outer membrane beta-barrel domain-containing protein [Methylocella silvestris]